MSMRMRLARLLFVGLFLGMLVRGVAGKDDLIDSMVSEMGVAANQDDLALLSGSFLGDLSAWNGASNPAAGLPRTATLAVPTNGAYRIWLRREAGVKQADPVRLTLGGANAGEHRFGAQALTTQPAVEQEKSLPVRFENGATRASYPSGPCWVWEFWDMDLKAGDTRVDVLPERPAARFTHLFLTRSKSFVPNLGIEGERNLDRVYYRFRVREADKPACSVVKATMAYHWYFKPDGEIEDIWWVGLGARKLRDAGPHLVPLSEKGEAAVRNGEWTAWLDASWSSLGAGPWGTGDVRFQPVTRGLCDVQLAWYPHPAAVDKTITVEIDEATALFCAPLYNKGKGKAVAPDPAAVAGVWGVLGADYLARFKTTSDFNRQFRAQIEEARQALGLTGAVLRLPSGLRIVTPVKGRRSELRDLSKTLAEMGINGIWDLPSDLAKDAGMEPALTASAFFHTCDPADPARPALVRRAMELKYAEAVKKNPDYPVQVTDICVGDEIGNIAGASKIAQSVACMKRFRAYLARILQEKGETPAFFGVEELADLPCLAQMTPQAGLYEKRLYSYSMKFREVLNADYYRTVTSVATGLYPNVRTFANYSPAPLRQGDQTMNGGGWFGLVRNGGVTMSWGEDWVYKIGSFTGYEIVGYYAALTACAARRSGAPSGFYVVPYCGNAAGNIVSVLSRNIKTICLFNFGPGYNGTGMEGNWSDQPQAYPQIVKALHVAAFAGRPLAEGRIESRRVALLYNRDHEIMYGGSRGEQTDRALTFAALANCHWNADIVLNEDLTPEILARYGVLVLNGFCLPREAVPVIGKWVEQGGLLIASAGAGSRDATDGPLPEMDTLFGASQEVLDLSPGYFSPIELYKHKPVGTITVQETLFTPALTAEVVGLKVGLRPTTAQPVATFEDGTCAATLRALGKGHVLLWGVQPGILYKGRRDGVKSYVDEMSRYADARLAVFEKPLRQALGDPPLTADAPQLELTRFDLGSETAILVNNMRKFDWRADMPPAEIRLRTDQPVREVSSAMKGALAWKRDGEWVKITLPVPESVDSIRMR